MRDNQIRLNKYIAESGRASRRGADQLIAEGSVSVNGKRVFELGLKVDPSTDRILVAGKLIKPFTQKFYFAFHKPKHVLTTMEDPEGRPTIADYVKRLPVRLFPVGRLDWDTEGLILLTNDGEFAMRVNHPRFKVTKTYLTKINGHIRDEQIERLKKGVSIEGGGRVRALAIEKSREEGRSENYDWIKITIGEGKNRQIHKMLAKVGFDVIKLQRIAIGRFKIGQLERGQFVELNEQDIKKIFISPVERVLNKTKTAPKVKRTPKKSAKRIAREMESKSRLKTSGFAG